MRNEYRPQIEEQSNIEELPINQTEIPTSRVQQFKQKLQNLLPKVKELIMNMLSPPLVSIFFAIIIAIIPPVKEFLIVNPPIFISSIKHICKVFSQAVSPAALIVLGGNLALTLVKEDENGGDQAITNQHLTFKEKVLSIIKRIRQLFRVRHIHPLAIALSVFVKLIVFPLIGIGFVALAMKLSILPSNDPVLILVVLVQFSMPMSMSLATLSSLNKDSGQEQVCELLLWHYLLCPFTLSLFSTWFLSLSCQFLDTDSSKQLCNLS